MIDLADLARAIRDADGILETGVSAADLLSRERDLVADPETSLRAHLAAKLARSRRLVLDRKEPFHASIVFAVFNENRRILRPSEDPLGEDFLRVKIEQLRWLFGGQDSGTFDLVVVDDGCPEGSGRLVEEVLGSLATPVDARVLFLAEAIASGHPAARGLTSTDESRKGGAIRLGLWEAAGQRTGDHVVLFTDADLSTNLGQVGLLVDGVLEHGADAAIGSRREPTSVVVKTGVRNRRGKLFIYLWKRILPDLGDIVDTQCGFKAWRADVVRDVVRDSIENGFSFDIEMILRTLMRRPGSIRKVPIAWFDSEAASTLTALNPYLSMLRSIVAIARQYRPPTGTGEEFATFIDSLDEDGWARLVDRVPSEIADREPAEFDRFDRVSVADLRALS
jgi:hypothetical protein